MIPDGPHNVVISPDIEYVIPGDVLKCSADANPPGHYYRWTDFNNPDKHDKTLKEFWYPDPSEEISLILSRDFLARDEVMIICTVINDGKDDIIEANVSHSFRMSEYPIVLLYLQSLPTTSFCFVIIINLLKSHNCDIVQNICLLSCRHLLKTNNNRLCQISRQNYIWAGTVIS